MSNDPTETGLHTTVDVAKPVAEVWEAFVTPSAIIQWNSATPEWHTPHAENDLQPGGRFNYRMEARDGSMGFDLTGTFDVVEPQQRLGYTMDDGRRVRVDFEPSANGTLVHQWFEPESQNPAAMQRDGWQSILESFKHWIESR